MGPRYLIFVSEPAQGNDSHRYGENEPPGLCVISAPRLKVPAQGPRKTGWPRPWSIMTGALRSGTPPSKVKCQGPAKMAVSMLLNETRSSSKAPECPQCHGDMTIAFLVSGKRQDFVGYTCDDCGKHISRIVPSD
jgi:hypothetical protein